MKRFDVLYQSMRDVVIQKLLFNYYLRDIPAGWEMEKPHAHNAMEIVCCIDGTFNIWINDEKNLVSVKKSECLIIQQGALHRLYLEDNTHALCACVQLNKDLIEIDDVAFIEEQFDILNSKSYEDKGFIKILDDGAISDRIVHIIKEANEKETDWDESIRFDLVGLFIKIYKNIKKQHQAIVNKSNVHIQRAMSYIYENLLNPITPKDIASHVHVSPNHLMHLFQDIVGKSIMETVMEIRAGRGRTLLENTTLPISEIAYQCGYPSLQHFSMAFKKTFGTSPTEYRKRVSDIDLLQSR